MEYNFRKIEKDWQDYWAKNKTFRANNNSPKEKYYVLDMFPYPSGAGLHVGHPLGYIASDIVARYKRLKGFNVLHPMGYDSFGLPAEQYAIQTGQHPAVTTEKNIERYREQLDKIGFSFDWDREVRTSDPKFYRWTQWIFLQLFNAWYNKKSNKAEPVETLAAAFEKNGSSGIRAACDEVKNFSAGEWENFSEKDKSDVLMGYRLAYLSEAWVNWCPQLGTVLANEEVKDGVSERGGYPVERKLMPQWSLRITAYADRLLDDLDKIDWSEAIKEQQRNWIGRSEGSSLKFKIQGSSLEIEVFTTRPDTIFGATFLTLAPEHELVSRIASPEYKKAVDEYMNFAKNRSERERMADVKKVTGQFTGAYALHPFTGMQIPVWTGDYVLAGYGTGAVMGVPAHDTRDYAFAKHFGLQVKKVIQPDDKEQAEAGCFDTYDGKCINSGFLNGLPVKDAIKKAIAEIEKKGIGKGRINYRLRDAVFGRQRYWGEPVPIYYEDGIPKGMDEKDLPLVLSEIDKFLPTETGEPPLARAQNWKYKGKYEYEKTTMPGWAGSSWYYLRYMVQDVKHIKPEDDKCFADERAINCWRDVDLYIGGAEHATGHLLYVRFWTKFLKDLGYIPIDEPAKKLINQGMIQGESAFVLITTSSPVIKTKHNINFFPEKFPLVFISKNMWERIVKNEGTLQGRLLTFFDNLYKKYKPENQKYIRGKDYELSLKNMSVSYRHVPVNIVNEKNELDINKFIRWENAWRTARGLEEEIELFCEEDGKYICHREVEKMSKSKLNVVCPDNSVDEFTNEVIPGIVEKYGADTLRLYEMFLGPLEQSKPWNTNGITGVHNFLKKFWRLFHADGEKFSVSEDAASKAELKSLHKTIKKAEEDIERYSFNTSVSSFMICVNELTELKCSKRAILEPLTIILAPYAPHIAEELWKKLGHTESITYASWPSYNEAYLKETAFNYPVSVNGRTKFFHEFDLSLSKEALEKEVLALEHTKKILAGKVPRRIIVVPSKIVNIVV